MEHTQKQAPSSTKVLLFRQQGTALLKAAQNAGVLDPEIQREVQKLLDRNAYLEQKLESSKHRIAALRKHADQQHGAIVQYRRMHLEMYEKSRQRLGDPNISRERYTNAIFAAVAFFVTTCVLTLSIILTLLF